jgi:hypothetical protein
MYSAGFWVELVEASREWPEFGKSLAPGQETAIQVTKKDPAGPEPNADALSPTS